MSRFPELAAAAALVALTALPAVAEPLGLGRAALPEEIAAWDLDVAPDGAGLPPGSGDVLTGEEVFAEKCAACHGDFAEGRGNWPKLAGGMDTLDRKDPLKTVGSYWPYLSTAWDYIHRSMPFGDAQSLTVDEVYSTLAYILYSNDLVDEDFVLSRETFLEVEMPNVDGFIVDDRIETEHSLWVAEPCMENCKDEVKITMRAAVLDVTPDDGTTDAAPAEVEAVAAEAAPAETAAPIDPALVEAGENVFRKCKSCHQVGDKAKNRVGPILTGVVGNSAGAVDGFKYSPALTKAAEDGLIWTDETLAAFLSDPKGYLKGTKMNFPGVKDAADVAAIVAYLSSFE